MWAATKYRSHKQFQHPSWSCLTTIRFAGVGFVQDDTNNCVSLNLIDESINGRTGYKVRAPTKSKCSLHLLVFSVRKSNQIGEQAALARNFGTFKMYICSVLKTRKQDPTPQSFRGSADPVLSARWLWDHFDLTADLAPLD